MVEASVRCWFSTHEVVVLSGFSKHMLDYLRREDIFAPAEAAASGRGVRRRYTYSDVVLLRALQTICAGKGKIRHLRESLALFRLEFGSLEPGQRVPNHLVVQGNELCVRTASQGYRQLRDGQMTLGFMVDLVAVEKSVAAQLETNEGGDVVLIPEAASRAEAVRQATWNPVRIRRQSLVAA